jgi:hypothetical protein
MKATPAKSNPFGRVRLRRTLTGFRGRKSGFDGVSPYRNEEIPGSACVSRAVFGVSPNTTYEHLLDVAQTSKSAVPQVSKPANCNAEGPTWKSAARQVWKPALRNKDVIYFERFPFLERVNH